MKQFSVSTSTLDDIANYMYFHGKTGFYDQLPEDEKEIVRQLIKVKTLYYKGSVSQNNDAEDTKVA